MQVSEFFFIFEYVFMVDSGSFWRLGLQNGLYLIVVYDVDIIVLKVNIRFILDRGGINSRI